MKSKEIKIEKYLLTKRAVSKKTSKTIIE